MKKILFVCLFIVVHSLFSQEFYLADSLYQAGNYDKALATYMKSNNEFKFFKIAKFYENQEDFTSAHQNYMIYTNKFPKDYNSNYEYAKFLYDNKLIDQSIEILNRLALLQENTLVYYYLGLCYEKKNELKLAKENFVKASKTDSYHLKSNYKTAFYYAMESKYDEALTIIKRILSKNKNKTDFILLNAQIYYNKKEFKKALENYQLVINLFESEKFIYEKVARCYTQLENYQKAIDTWQEIIKLFDDVDNPDIEYALGTNYAYLKNVKMAETHFLKSVKLKEFTFENEYYSIAKLHKDNGNTPKAITYLNKTIKEKSDYAAAHYDLLILTENKYNNKELLAKYEKLYQTFQKDYPKEVNEFLVLKIESLKKLVFLNN